MNKLKRGLLASFDHISECMTPIIPIVLAGGIFKMIVLLLTAFHVLSGTTEVILSSIATTPFYFLPVMVAYSAAKHFDTDPFIAIISVCTMLLPDFTALMESGEKVTFIGIPVVAATYAYSVIPIILLIHCMSHIVALLKKVIKENLQPYLLAACAILITSLLGILTIHCYIFTFPSIPSILIFYSADEPNNLMKAVVVAIVSFIASFVITAAIYRDADEEVDRQKVQ